MESEDSNQLIILGKELVRMVKEDAVGHPISLLYQCSQITRVPVEFIPVQGEQTGMFVFEVHYAGLHSVGSGSTKKEAKKNAADNFVSKALESVRPSKESQDSVENKSDETEVDNDEEEQTEDKKKPESSISAWREIMVQLSHKETDSVRLLAIFAVNSSTESPKYQVTKTLKENKKMVGYKVMVTWNQFFMESEAKTRVEAERKSALKIVNKIRELCWLDLIPEEKCLENIDEEEDTSILDDEDIPEEIRTLLTKHEAILTDETSSQSCVQKLETFSEKIQCPVLPNYSISSVSTSGCMVTVEVECSWLTLSSSGSASSRSAAEEEAASSMIRDTRNIINKLKKIEARTPPVLDKDPNPVKYLVYPADQKAASVTVTSNDYLCLQRGQYLNDVIIDFYLKYLQCGLMEAQPMMTKTYIFSIYFYSRLITKSKVPSAVPTAYSMHNNVKKWTKNVNIFEKEFIVIPINECDHWFVVIICFPNLVLTSSVKDGVTRRPLMIILDSLEDGQKSKICSNLRTYLSMEWKAKMGSDRQFSVETLPAFCPRIPQQTNQTDCGIFLLQYVETFYDKPLTDFTTPLENLASWFSQDCIKTKRDNIASIIRELSAKDQAGKEIQFPKLDFGGKVKSEPETEMSEEIQSKIQDESEDPSESTLKRKPPEEELDVKKLKEDSDSNSMSAFDWLEDY